MTYDEKVAAVLSALVAIPLCLHLWRARPAPARAWRALMEHPHRPGVQWPHRPYDWEEDGL